MCDDLTEADNRALLSRRRFTVLGASALGAMWSVDALGAGLTEREVTIQTPDGICDAYFVHPAAAAPAVLIWPDILGLRPAFRAMGKRLAAEGYAVLVVNPFYRSAPAPVVAEGDTFKDPAVREKVLPMARALGGTTHITDAKAFVGFLDAQAEVDTSRKIGTAGYCMGGPMVLRAAATLPERIGAGASFHGGGLVTEEDDSPHLGIARMKASMLIAVADNDHQRDPAAVETLKQTFADAKLTAEVEVYTGANHGWCPPDSPVHDEALAEKAWGRMVAIFGDALKPA